jgi:DNA-binding transcriptional regulator YiaG
VTSTKPGSKYYNLYKTLGSCGDEQITLSFKEIEAIIESNLPPSARQNKEYWSNRGRGGVQAAAWMDAGFHVKDVDLRTEEITFSKPVHHYVVNSETDDVRWDGPMIHALRKSMGMNQSEFADVLGVRQQTISEWENSVYLPTRARSNHITMVAERSDFLYNAEK